MRGARSVSYFSISLLIHMMVVIVCVKVLSSTPLFSFLKYYRKLMIYEDKNIVM